MTEIPLKEHIAPSGEPMTVRDLASCPPPERWQDWIEYDARAWPRKVEKHYAIIPTICFNCEAACGLLAYIDKETNQVKKFEGNPYHPGSRGRNCAKGPATINQVNDPERIFYPLKRAGKRGEGKWERTTWDEVLDTFASKIRAAIIEGRRDEIMYHVGRPGHDGYMERVLGAWGVDGHNSHTNVCSSSARFGYHIWCGADRPSPDHANARFILLISSHLETGHYFNPQAQRIIEGKMKGAKLAVMDPRLSNTASMADYWLPTWPGSEAAVLLAMARVILVEGLYNREYMERWVNWREFMAAEYPNLPCTFDRFIELLFDLYEEFTPSCAAKESGLSEEIIVNIARQIGQAGTAFAAHTWRAASAGNLGGWQVSRALWFLSVLTGSLGIRKYFESPYQPGQKLTIEEYYRWIFENSVPGLPEAAAKENLSPLEYMRKYGAFEIPQEQAPIYTKTGAGPKMPSQVIPAATCIAPASTMSAVNTCSSPPSACPPSFTPVLATPSGCTRSRTPTRSGFIPSMPNA